MAERRLEMLRQRAAADGRTCERCGATGEGLRRAAESLRAGLAPLGVEVALLERTLPPLAPLAESNRVFFNGRALEDLLDARVGMSHCPSCRDLLGERAAGPCDCRVLLVDGAAHEALPLEMILRAGRLAARDVTKQ
jgi:hypothetical protein